jgi:hypothetical protein
LVTHPMTDQRCLTSAIARRSALTARPSSSSFIIKEIKQDIDLFFFYVTFIFLFTFQNEMERFTDL